MLVPWPVTAADYVEREMLRIHSYQNGIWLSSNEEERFDCCRTARAGMDWRPGVAGVVLWANLNFLFWLSLIQFATTWIGENPLSPWPVALYGVALLMAGLAYFVLTKELIAHQSAGSMLAISIRRDRKGSLSILAYRVAIPLAFVRRWIASAFYVLVALMWMIPDRRIERALGNSE
jgi:hypothetical protein